MKKLASIGIAVAAVAVAVTGAIVVMNKKATQTGSVIQADASARVDATITYNGSSFGVSPSTVASGATVKIVNDSKTGLSFQSNPHPIHTENPQLNVGSIPAGSSKTIKLTTKGTWGFHNHLNAYHSGTITVQ